MKDADCVAFLQWALPRLDRPWAGFRKVRRQLCRRIERRIRALGLADVHAYRAHLESHDAEWSSLDALCPITISCFYRDTATWELLAAEVLPALAAAASTRAGHRLRALSLGCAAGEEPYTLTLAWQFALAGRFPQVALEVLATDVVEPVLARARRACYAETSIRLLPPAWRAHGFERVGDEWCLRQKFRDGVRFLPQDVCTGLPDGPFDLVLCRNLLFTYWDEPIQQRVLASVLERLHTGGALVIGRRERLPTGTTMLAPWPGAGQHGIFRYSPTG